MREQEEVGQTSTPSYGDPDIREEGASLGANEAIAELPCG